MWRKKEGRGRRGREEKREEGKRREKGKREEEEEREDWAYGLKGRSGRGKREQGKGEREGKGVENLEVGKHKETKKIGGERKSKRGGRRTRHTGKRLILFFYLVVG